MMNFNKAGLLALTLLCAGQAHAQDWIWELTTKMEMQGMPPGMGTQKSTSCIPQGKESEPDEKQSDCKITDRSSSGKITRFTMKCKEGTAKMEHELISAERWRSKMQMTGTGRGEEMTILTEAKRMGPCDAAKDGMMSQEAKAQLAASAKGAQAEADRLARECQQSVAQWPGNPTAFSTYDSMAKTRKDILSGGSGPDARRMADASAPEIPACAKAKPEYCGKTKAMYSGMSSRKGYADAMKGNRPDVVGAALNYCGAGNPAPLLAGHCKSAVGESDFNFIGAYCPEERKVLARQYCAGRSYTAIDLKHRAICGGGGYESSPAQAGSSRSGTASAAAGNTAQPDVTSEAIEQGTKALKGLFGF